MTESCLVFETDWGWMGIAGSPRGLWQVILPRQKCEEVEQRIQVPEVWEAAGREVTEGLSKEQFLQTVQELKRYLRGERVEFAAPIDWSGLTSFHRRVCEAARGVPYGEVRSYGWLARQVGSPRAARAVGQCMARNRLPLIIPCHRVVGSSGRLTGFGGGLDLKERLLRLERHV